ncbi:MAG: EamA family transporter [Spirochaetales bacterium]|nr:EamA family transporter [Spirochaetales bacterium]
MAGIIILWGSAYLGNNFALRAFPPFFMMGIRNLTAGLALYIFQRTRGAKPPNGKMWFSAFYVGILMLCGGSGVITWAQLTVPSGIAALVVGSVPLWMALLGIMVSRKTKTTGPGWIAIAGIVFGFLGIVLLIGPMNIFGSGEMVNPAGGAALIIGSVLWSFASLKSRTAVFPESRLLGAGMQMIGGGMGLLLTGFLIGEHRVFSPERISALPIIGLVYLTVGGSVIAFSIYTWLLWSAPTTLVSTYAYVTPIVAVILGALILHEPITLRLIVATIMILTAVVVVTLSSRTGAPKQ